MTPKLILYFLVFRSAALYGQPASDTILSGVNHQKLTSSVQKRISKIETKMISKGAMVLRQLQRQEEKIHEKQSSAKVFLDAIEFLQVERTYDALAEKLRNPTFFVASGLRQYIPHLDTLSSALKFLGQNNATANLNGCVSKIESFKERLQQAQEINDFICERQEILRRELGRLNLAKHLKRFNKETYRYHEQLKEYKALLSDSRKIEKKVIGLLTKTEAFREFIGKNSMLASLFRIPCDQDHPVSIARFAGLETRGDVNSLIRQHFTGSNSVAQLQFVQKVQQAQSQLNQVKEKLLTVSPMGTHLRAGDDVIPERFKPGNQKRRSLLKKLEFGVNIQAHKATNFFPATTDIGLSVGYKLNDKSTLGIGASYKAGWGAGWNHIELSSQGAGLRSFVDWKLKGSIWISGGYEMNYLSELRAVQISSAFGGGHAEPWQQSGLVGLSKMIDVKSKFFKKTKLQLLWDFLSYQQVPRTQPVIFRIDYNFK